MRPILALSYIFIECFWILVETTKSELTNYLLYIFYSNIKAYNAILYFTIETVQ